MKISSLSIERPVLATVLSLVIVLVGVLGLLRTSNRELPDVDSPVVSVTTVYTGASPEVIERSVTQPLEEEIIGIEGIRHLTSVSREQVSQINVEFELDRDIAEAANDVRDRVARARRLLPEDAEDPTVSKRDADASPILWISLVSTRLDQVALSELADTRIKDRLGKLAGVATVILAGERRYSIRVWIDNVQLAGLALTVADVRAALERGNVELPSGRVEGTRREFTVRTLGELDNAADFADLIVAERDGAQIRLRDVARVEAGPEDERKLVRFNGNPAVALGIVKQSKANTLAVADAVKAEVAKIGSTLSSDVRMQIAYDGSVFVSRSIRDVTTTIFEAMILVIGVIYLFLRRFRSTLIPATAIPISIIGSFAFIYFAGFSINTLTLMGLTLAIGLVVDDAIVVLENITRWVEQGSDPREAAHRGIEEISFAVLASTISVVAVFLPLAFLSDKTGRLFREFGVTVAAAVAISGFVALTLAPMLAARVLRPAGQEHGIKASLERAFEVLNSGYRAVLRPALARPGLWVAFGLAWFALGLWLLTVTPSEFVPASDRGNFFVITEAPEGSTIDYTDRFQRQVEEVVLATPEVAKGFSVVALGIGAPGTVNRGAMFVTLDLWEERDRTQLEIVDDLMNPLWDITGLKVYPLHPPSLGQRFGSSPVSLVLQGPEIAELADLSDQIMARAAEIPGLTNLRRDLVLDKPELLVEIDRELASDLGVSVRDIAATLQVLLGGSDLTTFNRQGETYNVMVQLPERDRTRAKDILGLYVRGNDNDLVPLSSVARVLPSTSLRSVNHFDRQRSTLISASLEEDVSLANVLAHLETITMEVIAGAPDYTMTFSGESEDYFESGNSLAFAYGLAVLIIYLVLAAQFESFVDPVTILVAVALSFTGALLALNAAGMTLNLFSRIGLVMLIGLVTKNSILIVEFANQLRARGEPIGKAIYEAAAARFRPILMTAISTIVGIMPIALGSGGGGEARAPLGVAVIGGMFFATGFTLFVVPAVYFLMGRLRDVRAHEPEASVG